MTREGQPRPGYSMVLRLGARVREAQRPAGRKAVEMSSWDWCSLRGANREKKIEFYFVFGKIENRILKRKL